MTPRKSRPQPVPGTPTIEIRNVPINTLLTDPRNARIHSRKNVEAIQASLRRFGQRRPIVVDKRNTVVAGNGTVEAMVAEGWEWCDVAVFPGTAEEARAYAIADNRTAELGAWDEDILLETLQSLPTTLQAAAGFHAEDFDGLKDPEPDPADSDAETPEKGSLLALAATTVGEGDFEVFNGETWHFGGHILVVADVHKGWPKWAHRLEDDMLFWPYPSLLAPFAELAKVRPILFVQPNLYLAGWLLTKWARITGGTPEREGHEDE